ncbi:MAG TPA: carboxyl transferase domain-containing protein [Streptosporangiaceae bacterium]|nr:carboxyl transferase domain-containing protein [Streptosporangiaceae bacterium]
MTADPARRPGRGTAARPPGPGRARPLYAEIADPGSLAPFGEEIEAGNRSDWPGYPDQLRRARNAAGSVHAVTTALATVGGEPCVLVGFEFPFLGGSMGTAEGARIGRAFAVSAARRLPVVTVAASGGSRMQEGTSALLQMQAVAAAVAEARRAGIPHIAVAGDPTTGGVWSSLVAAADVLIGVPGARVSFSGSRTRPAAADPRSPEFFADRKWARGFVDVLAPAPRLRAEVAAAVRLLSPRPRGEIPRRAPLPGWPAGGRAGPPAAGAWAHVGGARDPRRPRADRWLAGYFGHALEIRGDRCGGVDAGLRCGFGSHRGTTVAYVAQTGEPTTPAGFRTATRLLRLAERLRLPVLTLIDTPGAAASPADEAAGTGPAIAELLVAVASSTVPITSVVIGEGVSGGALALASPDDLWIARDGYLAVTAPELAASILKLGARDIPQVAAWLRLTPDELMSRGIVRGIVRLPAVPADMAGQAAEPR